MAVIPTKVLFDKFFEGKDPDTIRKTRAQVDRPEVYVYEANVEKDFDMVEFMTLDEFCDEIGFAKDHRHRLLQIYNRIQFDVDDHKERFYSIISNGIVKDNGKAHMFINPRIIYSGSQLDTVALLGKFCKV